MHRRVAERASEVQPTTSSRGGAGAHRSRLRGGGARRPPRAPRRRSRTSGRSRTCPRTGRRVRGRCRGRTASRTHRLVAVLEPCRMDPRRQPRESGSAPPRGRVARRRCRRAGAAAPSREPPLAEVEALREAGAPVGELALVDQQAGFGAASRTSSRIRSNGSPEKGTSPSASRSDEKRVVLVPGTQISTSRSSLEPQRRDGPRDRPVAVAHTRPLGQQRVAVWTYGYAWSEIAVDLEAALLRRG